MFVFGCCSLAVSIAICVMIGYAIGFDSGYNRGVIDSHKEDEEDSE